MEHLLSLLSFDKDSVDAGNNTASCDSCLAHVFGELSIVPQSQTDVTGVDAVLLIILSSVTSQLKEPTGVRT